MMISLLTNLFDDLTYKYYNNERSNRLWAVGDNADDGDISRGDFREEPAYNGASASVKEYVYHNNGNLKTDYNKGLSNVSYNELNLPSYFYMGSTGMGGYSGTFTYSGNGTKLKSVTKTDAVETTDYIGPFVYKNNVLDYIITSNGRVVFSGGNFSYYEFHVKDHLGNVRTAFKKSASSNTAEVLQKNDYYPFGLLMAESSDAAGTTSKNRYKYNGKELVPDSKMNWYDYGARMYDPQLGTFHSVDPLAEQFGHQSPFVYADNNPVRFIDFMGMNADGYTVDEDGNINPKPVNNEGGNNYDVIYNEKEYTAENKKDYDESGDKTGIKVSKGVVQSEKTTKHPIEDQEGNATGEVVVNHRYVAKNDNEATNIMKFMDKNTNVEWSNTLMKDAQGNNLNLLLTSHESETITGGWYQKDKYMQKGFQVIRDDHIHPDGISKPSGKEGEYGIGDKGQKYFILQDCPNAKFRILANGKYYPY